MEDNKLAKISLGINALLVIAVIILFVKMPAGTSAEIEEDDTLSQVNIPDDGKLTIAYYRSDTLSSQAQFVLEIQKQIEQVQVDAQNKMSAKEKEIQRWQKSWEDKGRLLPEEEARYMQEAQQKQMEIAQFEQNLNMQVASDQESWMVSLYKRLESFARTFCEKNEIDMLVSMQMGQNVVYMSPQFDVTKQFLNFVNKEHKKSLDGAEEEDDDSEGAED